MLSSKNVMDDRITLNNPRYLNAADFAQEDRRTQVAAGDVLLTIVGTVGRAAVVPPTAPRFTLQRSVAVLRPRQSDVEPRFLMFALQSILAQLLDGARGVAQKGLYLGSLRETEIPLPPLEEQQRIVAILDEAFEGLARAKANAEANLASAKELFDLAREHQLHDKKHGSELVTLADVVRIEGGLVDPLQPPFSEMLHIGAGNMVTGSSELVKLKTAKDEGLKSGKYEFSEGTVLYSKIRPYLRKVVQPDFAGICSADVYPLRVDEGRLAPEYLVQVLRGDHFTQYAEAGSARAGMPKVNRPHLFAYEFHLPPLEHQHQVAARLSQLAAELDAVGERYEATAGDADELRQSLLAKAFAGELT